MSCNKVRPINEFAHAQRQFAQPDNLQLDERDKLPDDQVLPVDLTQTELPEPGIEEEPSEWTLDIPMEIDMSQHNVGREDDLDEDDSSQDEERVALSSLMRSTPSDSRPVTLGPTQNQTIIQDMDLETLFE
ncbi:hypothetical protein PDE_08696 [Penicillium oxalicum 114-2]|uniref:Uncharacterized protein n=1 Tax=Penicillium oxalicum (strain 114-2 / CGMCC 5302) TaxID=933388 RepID=S7ZTH8_PENO1|nr:hypothetical protein PDE_08696 [Penicillium oxalicum 114-2]